MNKQHLLNQSNISVDILDPQQDILKAFNKHLDMISGSNFLDTVITDNLSYLNPLKQIRTFGMQNCSSYGSTINYVFVFLYGLEKTIKRQQS